MADCSTSFETWYLSTSSSDRPRHCDEAKNRLAFPWYAAQGAPAEDHVGEGPLERGCVR
jgi:hypothetical protein